MSPPTAQPLYFGPIDRPLFGWFHPVSIGAARRVGIVLCSPSGYEAICTHRTYRHFAEQAAALGFPALRFDYDGTGNSAGSTLDPQRVTAWVHSVAAAVDALKRQAGVDQVCLFGVRVGASLGAVAAQGRNDVRAMIAFAPVIKVKSYLREIRALALSRPQPQPPAGVKLDPTLQEAAGFATSEETRAEFGKIDLLQLAPLPIRDVLIMERDDLPADPAWPHKLTDSGIQVRTMKLDGYVDMMRDAHQSVVPASAIESALTWLTSIAPNVAHGDAARAANSTGDSGLAPTTPLARSATIQHQLAEADGNVAVHESPLFFNEQRNLFGVLSEPVNIQRAGSRRTVVILLNSGTIHHIGPSRLYVAISRLCAALGAVAMRIDLSGVGESPPRQGQQENAPYSASAQQDIADAIRFVAERFHDADVHLIGLCSGAYHGLKAAVRGVAVRSVVVINPLTFFWKEGMSLDYADFQVTSEAKRYSKSARQLSSWLKALRGEADLAAAAQVFTRRLGTRLTHVWREAGRTLGIALQDDLASELKRVAARRINMLFVFSSSDPGLSLLQEQGGRTVSRLAQQGALRISEIDGADHTFTAQWNRDQLIAVLMAHLRSYAATM